MAPEADKADKATETTPPTAPPMVKPRTWPAYLILALCGAPIFTIAASKIVHDTPVESLVVELDAEGNATLTANRRWTSEERTGFRLPRDGDQLHDAMEPFMREAERDPLDNLPICHVRIVTPADARAGPVREALVATMRCYLWDVTLESDGLTVTLALPKNEGGGHARAVPRPRNVQLANLHLPRSEQEWSLQIAHISQAVTASSDTLFLARRDKRSPSGSKSGVAADIGDRTVVRDLDIPGVGILDAPEWSTLVKAADEKKTVALDAPEGADLTGIDGAYVLTDLDAHAADLVRALKFLTSREGLKVYIVWPEREGDEDWWAAP